MVQRIIEDKFDKGRLLAFIERQDPPFTCSISKGGRRSVAQNKLAFKWYGEIAEQLPGTFETVEDARAHCKLHHGVPIIRAVDEDFRQAYDEKIRPAPYPFKLALMKAPFDWPITSKMNTKQLSAYLDAVHREFSGQGVELTIPEDKSLDWRPEPPVEAYEMEGAR
ncbi:hypothetical protein [Pelagibacterium lentulum]|uniref:Uncharacterized protein n=1 Tax=Pelagibacterium lentulum TaxID=2029865 RepID=A0A916RC83_9HYPH|nr:hypothetical protein [Pelagibacterium lentulum]GGA45880.1 hypothetical protein GCM10011499_14530 [Pelagibacterium lentulum]